MRNLRACPSESCLRLKNNVSLKKHVKKDGKGADLVNRAIHVLRMLNASVIVASELWRLSRLMQWVDSLSSFCEPRQNMR